AVSADEPASPRRPRSALQLHDFLPDYPRHGGEVPCPNGRCIMPEVRNPTSPTQQHGGVGETLRHTASGVAEPAGQVQDKVQDAASSMAHSAEEAWDSASQGVRRGAHAAAETAENFWDEATGLVRRYPVASVLIAFGLGCLVASMF